MCPLTKGGQKCRVCSLLGSRLNVHLWEVPGGYSHIKLTGVLLGNFKRNPYRYQNLAFHPQEVTVLTNSYRSSHIFRAFTHKGTKIILAVVMVTGAFPSLYMVIPPSLGGRCPLAVVEHRLLLTV